MSLRCRQPSRGSWNYWGYHYDAAGRVDRTTDPRGVVTQTAYDLLGRPTQIVDAYDPTVNGGQPTDANNQTTEYTYDGLDHALTVTAVMPAGTPSQTTRYVYGVTTAGGSAVDSNDRLATLEYPDPATGSPSTAASNQKSYTYDALGEALTATDPNGTTHTYTYDVLGRQTADAVTALGAGVDGAVRRLTTAYDSAGNAYLFTSYDAPSGGNVVNQVERVYNGLGQLTGEYQAHAGAVDPATTPEVRYTYAEMANGRNNSRPVSTTYPNGRVVDDVYNAGIDDAISRVSALADDNGGSPGTLLETYQYLGLDTVVDRNRPQPVIDLTYLQQPGDASANSDGGDPYTGLDRFGRVIDQNWVNTATGTAADRYQYGYDADGNRLYQADLVDAALSELYHANSTQAGDDRTAYDPLGRLTGFARGVLSASGNNGATLDTVASPSQSQSWQLDALGNWTAATTNGATTTRTFNAQNQTTGVSGAAAPAYDAAGNTTGDGGQAMVYDAWDRLVAVKDAASGAPLAGYAYDALGRRVTESRGASSQQTAPPAVPDGGFEPPPVVGSDDFGAFMYDPTGTPWSFSGGAGIAGNASGFTGSNPPAPEGVQVAFLQEVGSISQSIPGWAAGTYQIHFDAAQRYGDPGQEDFEVLVDENVVGTFTPAGTAYATYTTAPFTVAAGSHTIAFVGLDSAGGDNSALLDDVRVAVVTLAVPDGGFEPPPVVGSGTFDSYSLDPTGTPWTFSGLAGIAGNGSGFTSGNPPAPEGVQVAFLQGVASFSQSVAGWAAGTYTITFDAAQRAGNASRQDVRVLVDGAIVGTFTPPGTGYIVYTTAAFTVTAGSHTVTFQGLDSAGGDITAFIDDIRVAAAAAAAPATTTDLYYSAQWQVIEERQGGTAAADVSRQYVWSLAYVDALVLRDDYQNGAPAGRLYALQDANWDTAALADTSGHVVERYTYDPYGAVTVLDAGGTPRPGDASVSAHNSCNEFAGPAMLTIGSGRRATAL
jgi:YD repeat-containing protein